MPMCKIIRYVNGNRTEHSFVIPMRVTVTGKENHFARAYEDASQLMLGMIALETYQENQDPTWDGHPAKYWLQSVSLD